MTDETASVQGQCDHPRPGAVLFLADPYCWWPNPDVRDYLNRPAFAVRIDPCPTCQDGSQ